jgi:hypothetical protein
MKRSSDQQAQHRASRAAAMLCAIAAILATLARAQEMNVPVDIQAAILPKILSFERSTSLEKSGLVVGILYQSRVRSSLVCANDMAELLPRSSAQKGIQCVMIEMTSESEVSRRLAEEGVNLVYVTPMRSLDIGGLGRLLQSRRVLSFTGVPSYVDAGVALGVDTRENRPVILVNLTATKAVGAEFSSQMLRLARVVE